MKEARRHEFSNADIDRRAAVACAEIGAKDQIPNHHVLAVIPVRLAQILAVVPAVHLGRVEDPGQRTEAHLDVAVRQHADEAGERAEPYVHRHVGVYSIQTVRGKFVESWMQKKSVQP